MLERSFQSRSRRTLALAAALLAACAWFAHGGALAEAEAPPIVVKVHADWCGTCTRLNATWEELDRQVGDRATLVILNVTDRDTLEVARADAERLGILEFFEANQSKTGTIAVLDGATRSPVVVLKGDPDVAKYVAAVDRASAKDAS